MRNKTPQFFRALMQNSRDRGRNHLITAINATNQLCRWQSTDARPKMRKDDEIIRKTSLMELHEENGAKFVKFAGFYLPMNYENVSIVQSHRHTRSYCSVFDVSHMMQTRITGAHSIPFIESICVSDIAGMSHGKSTLSLFTDKKTGGILDDVIVTKISDGSLFVVSNASRRHVDKDLLRDALESFQSRGKDVDIEFLEPEDYSLIAIQGPITRQVIQPFVNFDFSKLYFMTSVCEQFFGIKNCRITRCGYTGEDGIEVSIPSKYARIVVEKLLENENVKLAGLGARDTLRLEAGLCLYGNDINDSTTPIEAGLGWTIGKRRKLAKDFPGAAIILDQIKNGVIKKRVGLRSERGPPARAGSRILNSRGDVVGFVTSGCPSPSLEGNVAMAYVDKSHAEVGNTSLRLDIRNNLFETRISKMPFVPAKYYAKEISN